MKKRHPNILIGYTGYNLGKTHQYVGIRQLVTMVDYWAPQVYWAHNGSSPEEFLYRGYDQWYSLSKEIGYDIVIAPVGQAYWVDGKRHMDLPKGTSEFTDFAKATAGYVSISWYHGDDLLSRPWAVTAIAVADKAR